MSPLRRIARSPLLTLLLIATYPIAFLWSINVAASFPWSDVFGAWLVALAVTAVIFVVVRLLTRETRSASLITAAMIIAIATFGHVERWIGVQPASTEERWLLVAVGLLLVSAVTIAATRGRSASDRFFVSVNAVVGLLVLLNVVGVAVGASAADLVDEELDAVQRLDTGAWAWSGDGAPRDVYYLVFDRYANAQVLERAYGFDNTAFLDALRQKGFTVVDDAIANYPQTAHSLASSLNMTYLDEVARQMGEESGDFGPIWRSLSDSTVVRVFDELGYKTIHIGSWWEPSRMDPGSDVNIVEGAISEFQAVLQQNTIIPALGRVAGVDSFDFRQQEFRRIGSQFRALEDIAGDPDTTFTFAHFTLPHPPYVFKADGSFDEDAGRPIGEAYLAQLQAANTMIDGLLTDLVAGPPEADPIIIVQSDEGPYPIDVESAGRKIVYEGAPDEVVWRKMMILNAYHLPGDGAAVPESITPVNTFRLVFDRYFGADLPLLPDRAYVYADQDHPYALTDVTDRLRDPSLPRARPRGLPST